MMTLIKGGHIVNEGRVTKADIIIEDGKIAELSSQNSPITSHSFDSVIDATGCTMVESGCGAGMSSISFVPFMRASFS